MPFHQQPCVQLSLDFKTYDMHLQEKKDPLIYSKLGIFQIYALPLLELANAENSKIQGKNTSKVEEIWTMMTHFLWEKIIFSFSVLFSIEGHTGLSPLLELSAFETKFCHSQRLTD